MSMRLKGMLNNHLHAQLEQRLIEDAVVLRDIPCEMTFQTVQGYMEFEDEKHSYLPVFHLIGSVKEIRGDFPFHVSSLYFGDEDSQYLTKDILYYPNPQEIAHMITVGQFYTKNFRIPEILDMQEYSFPAKVNLTIVPPPNPAAYEMATYGGDFVAETDDEKLNLPIVYVQLAGTGITRKNDKLLDYYGVDFEDGFEIYPLTAESSGYVDPPLMMYIETPQVVDDFDRTYENDNEMYITKEEEAQMIRDQREHSEPQNVVDVPNYSDEYQATSEDIIIAQAVRSIEKRVAERVKENEAAKQSQMESEVSEPVNEHDDMLDFLENTKDSDFIFVGQDVGKTPPSLSFIDDVGEFISNNTNEEHVYGSDDMIDLSHENSVDLQESDILGDDFISDEVVSEVHQPDEPQQQADVKMDFNPETNMFVEQEKEEDKASNDGLVDEDSDRIDMENMQGADVQDASLQAKLDEAHTRDVAINAAVSVQDDIVKRDKIKHDVDKHDVSKREIPSSISDIAEKYDASKSDVDLTEYQ